MLSVFLFATTSQALAAPSTVTQREIFDRQIPYYNVDACGPDSATNTDTGGIQPGPIYILGDSISVIAKDAYKKKFEEGGWSPTISALSGRQIATGSESLPSGLEQVAKDEQDAKAISGSSAVVVELGTNGLTNSKQSTKSAAEKLLTKIKSYNNKAPVFWVNVYDQTNKSASKTTNEAISSAIGTDGTIIDWYKEADSSAKGKFEGGVHPVKAEDINLLADLVYESVSSKASDSSNVQVTGNLDEDVGASTFTDAEGYRSDQLRGTYSFAELSPEGTAPSEVTQQTATNLGKLKYKQRVAITYKDKTVVAQKLDIGTGGDKVKGKVRAIDLTFDKTAKALGVKDPDNFLDVVHVKTVSNSTPLGPVDNPGSLEASSQNVKSTDPPVIVLDPGHSGSDIERTDSKTGLYDHDWSNTYETEEMYKVSKQVESKLTDDGYKVILTKKSSTDNVYHRQRAEIANDAKADLAVSIHNQHQTSWDDMGGGDAGQVYAQVVGGYRQNKAGMGRGNKKVEFTSKAVADKSKKYAQTFAETRTDTEKHSVKVRVNSGFTSRADIASGDLSLVQLFSKVPWVYNEVGAPNGPMPKSQMDLYAEGIIKSIEKAVPVNSTHDSSSQQNCACTLDGGASPDGTVSLSGSDNEEQVFNYFVAKGLSGAQAAGIVGNLNQESGVDPKRSNGYIAQWTGGRLSALESLAKKQNRPVTDMGVQLDYIWLELTGGEGAGENDKQVLENLKKTNTPEDAAVVFSEQYERPGIPRIENRKTFARQTYDKYGDGSPSATVNSACGGSGDCQSATGSARLLCVAKKYEGIYYQWGGGHIPYSKFKQECPDPTNPPNNQASGGPKLDGGKSGNPSPCAVDCSGLVSVAVSEVTNDNYSWTVGDSGIMEGTKQNYWKKINISEAKAGDIVTKAGHVEFVDHISGDKVYSFGTRQTGTKAGPLTMPKSYWSGGAWTWTGPGA